MKINLRPQHSLGNRFGFIMACLATSFSCQQGLYLTAGLFGLAGVVLAILIHLDV